MKNTFVTENENFYKQKDSQMGRGYKNGRPKTKPNNLRNKSVEEKLKFYGFRNDAMSKYIVDSKYTGG
jgi:hypothetical protein